VAAESCAIWFDGHDEESISRLTVEVKEIAARIRIPGESAPFSALRPYFI
jgi:hypothetical protein